MLPERPRRAGEFASIGSIRSLVEQDSAALCFLVGPRRIRRVWLPFLGPALTENPCHNDVATATKYSLRRWKRFLAPPEDLRVRPGADRHRRVSPFPR